MARVWLQLIRHHPHGGCPCGRCEAPQECQRFSCVISPEPDIDNFDDLPVGIMHPRCSLTEGGIGWIFRFTLHPEGSCRAPPNTPDRVSFVNTQEPLWKIPLIF